MIKNNYPIILLYHQITQQVDETIHNYDISMGPKIFESHVKAIKKNFAPINVEEFEYARKNNRDIRQRILFTFDDGYRDATINGGGILRKYGFDSIWFVNSGLWGNTRVFWLSKIMWIYEHGLLAEFVAMVDSRFPGLIAKLEGNNSEYIDSWGKDNYSRVLERLVDEFFNRYADEEKIARRARLFASPLEIKTLAKNAHIGNHSVSHSNMRNISLSDFKEEVKGCEFAIREIIGKKSRYFAFPFGQFNHHWNFAGVSILKEMGFESIFSVENPGYSAKGKPWGDVIPRFEVPCNITTTTGLKDFIRSCNG